MIDDTPAITVGQIEMKCREFEKNSSRKLDMVIIDYLKLMYCENPNKHPRLSDLAESSAAG
ncbi:MAG: hypothetical protein KHZ87_07600 [Clostridiales bacterium]|nr:hypothetical protein [Clostridiales bacterium]MBS5877103.1 hypothetical protein [Clostridiales bacterium]